MFLFLRLSHFTPIISYAAVFISSSFLYWAVCWLALHAGDGTRGLGPALLMVLLLRVSFVGMEPLGSDDVYRYIWDGRVQAAGINPYRFAPEDTALQSLHTEELPSLVNHPNMKTIYFPLTQWLFHIGYQLGGEGVWSFQFLILLAEVLTITGLVRLMRELSRSPWHTLIYAACPLVLLQFSLDAHVDALGFPLLVFAFLLYHRRKTTLSLILFGLSMLVKPVALVILPILLLDQRGFANKLKVAVLPLAVLCIPFLPYMFTANPFEALAAFSRDWMFNGALFSLLFPLFSDNQTTRLWCLAFLSIMLSAVCLSRKSLHEKVVLSLLLLFLCSPVVHPWYLGWLIVLLPLAPLRSGLTLAGTASLTSITFVTYQLQGIWKDYPLVLTLEYVPVVVLLLIELTRRRPFSDTPLSSSV
jgi:alpha-1,6-mannosyltransferase